jgi:hypothetical protein
MWTARVSRAGDFIAARHYSPAWGNGKRVARTPLLGSAALLGGKPEAADAAAIATASAGVRSFGVRQLAAAFPPANLLAGI